MSSLPPNSILTGAGRWLDLLERVDRTRAWRQLRTGAYQDLTPTQYAAAFDWLVEIDLIDLTGRTRPNGPVSLAERALEAVLERANPAWLADEGVLSDLDDLPVDLVQAAECLFVPLDEARRLAQARAGKVNTERRALVGAMGERLFVELLRRCTPHKVSHVSLDSDHWGFDVRIADGSLEWFVEVKTSAPGPRLEFFLSRHEVEVAKNEERWSLVVVRLKSDEEIGSLAVIDRTWILDAGPIDKVPSSRWDSARLRPDGSALTPGLTVLNLTPVPGIADNDARLIGMHGG